MSMSRQPASSARRIASPLFSSRRDDERRQIRVCPPGCEHDRVGEDGRARPVVDVEAVGPEGAPVADEQPGDVEVVEEVDAQLERAAQERHLDLAPGVVAREAGAPVAVRAEVALQQLAVVAAREVRPVADEVVDRPRRLLGEQLDRARVAEVVALAQRVGGVLLPGVLRVGGRQRGVDAARGEDGVGVVAPALADAQDLHAPLGELDRGAQAGDAGPDDEDAGGKSLVVHLPWATGAACSRDRPRIEPLKDRSVLRARVG
jgi:hypothetical protein